MSIDLRCPQPKYSLFWSVLEILEGGSHLMRPYIFLNKVCSELEWKDIPGDDKMLML